METKEELKAEEERAEFRQNVEEHNREMALTEKSQLKYQKLGFIMSMLSAIFTGIILLIVLLLVGYVVPKVDNIYASMMISLNNLETLTAELNQADLGGTVQNINTLTVQATGNMSDTMKRLDSIDLEKLNQAIDNLNSTIEPMAKFFASMR